MADFLSFKNQFKGDLVTPDDSQYAAAIARWAINAVRLAKIVAFVKDEADVALAIKYARVNQLPIAIRCGGHSPAGASSSEGGLVIDLSRYLIGVRIDAENKKAYVGGGAVWETVDNAAIQHGLATVAGTVNHTGVSGLLLGGGFGWLSSAHGLAVDNLLQATIVSADGSILTASDTENSDLFFGIRGGGSNFGIATELVLRLHPQRRTVYAGIVVFSTGSIDKILQVTNKWFPTAGEKEAMLQFATVGQDGNPAYMLCLFYNGSEAEGRANYKDFFDIGPLADLTREIPYEELNTLQNAMTYHGQCAYMTGLSQPTLNLSIMNAAHAKVAEVWKRKDFKGSILFEYFPLQKINSIPSDATAFRRDPKPSMAVLVLWKENNEENSQIAREMVHGIVDSLNGGEANTPDSFGYSNYQFDVSADGKAKVVFGDNYARLQGLKKRYDPDSIFNKWFSITPA